MDIERLIDEAIERRFPKKYDCAYAKEEQCEGKVVLPDQICKDCYSQYGDGS